MRLGIAALVLLLGGAPILLLAGSHHPTNLEMNSAISK